MLSPSLGRAWIDRTSGGYERIGPLGRGGMAEVDLVLGQGPAGFRKLFVVKRLLAERCFDERFVAMFLGEARLAARLNHPHIVQTLEVSQDGDSYFIVMEFLEGQSLGALLHKARPGPLPFPVVLRMVADACAGLDYAHRLADVDGAPLGIVHRDISPQNLFVTYAGQVKILDWGIAKAPGLTADTEAGVLKGKVGYMSPEQALGADVDARSDLFSLGVVLYESLVHRRIWGDSAKDVDVLRRLLLGDIPHSPRAIMPDLPQAVDAICRRALAPDRADRYPSALAMQEAIEKCLFRDPEGASPRAVGLLVSGLFAEERDAVAATIRDRSSLVRSSPHLGGPCALDPTEPGVDLTDEEYAPSSLHVPPPQARSRGVRPRHVYWLLAGSVWICLAAFVAHGATSASILESSRPAERHLEGFGLDPAATPPAVGSSSPDPLSPVSSADHGVEGPAPGTAGATGPSAPNAITQGVSDHASSSAKSSPRRSEHRQTPASTSRSVAGSRLANPAYAAPSFRSPAVPLFGPLDERK
jgi:serine/threonine protein kinase